MEKTVADLAWAAGIVDGEGSIFVLTQSQILEVTVLSTDPYMSAELQKLWPDSAVRSQKTKESHHSDALRWTLQGKKAARFLTEIRPFLKVKFKQADLAIEFQKHKRGKGHKTEEDCVEILRLSKELKQAKQDLKIGKNPNGN